MEISIPKNGRAVYASPDKSTIDCEVEVNGRLVPFTAHRDDTEPHGQAIYEALIQRGKIEPYRPPAGKE